jgi:adenosylhomocysteinase
MDSGQLKIEWAWQYMPVLNAISERFKKEKPFARMVIGMALHVEAKTANLVRTLADGEQRYISLVVIHFRHRMM